MSEIRKINPLRWLVLFIVSLNILFNYFYNKIFSVSSIAEITKQYSSLFVPSGYAFAIWGAIYLSWFIYSIVQLMPSQRDKKIYDKLAIPMIISVLFGMGWIMAFSSNLIGLSMFFIIGMLITSVTLLIESEAAVRTQNYSKWLTEPFSIYAGWLSVATIANTSIWLLSLGFDNLFFGAIKWTIIMILVASILGLIISYKFKNIIFPLVISWASIAIWHARKDDYVDIAFTAILTALFLIICTLTLLKRKKITL